MHGGTKDISRNETKKGLHSIKEFALRAIKGNVISPGAPYRYDLPPSSCVNTEVKLYNKRLQSLMSTCNYVEVLSMTTERRHRTKHGLHLNSEQPSKGNQELVSTVQVIPTYSVTMDRCK